MSFLRSHFFFFFDKTGLFLGFGAHQLGYASWPPSPRNLPSCLNLPSSGISGIDHPAWQVLLLGQHPLYDHPLYDLSVLSLTVLSSENDVNSNKSCGQLFLGNNWAKKIGSMVSTAAGQNRSKLNSLGRWEPGSFTSTCLSGAWSPNREPEPAASHTSWWVITGQDLRKMLSELF